MNRPLTESEWAEIQRQIVDLARKHNLDAVVYPPKKQPTSLPQTKEQERKRA